MGHNSMSEEEIRRAVVETARRSFLSEGIAKTQMNWIAQCVGISRSTLYLYFPSKVELVFYVARGLMRSISHCALQSVESSNPKDGFSAVHHHLAYILEYYKQNVSVVRFFDEFDTIYTDDYPDIEEARLYAEDMNEHMERCYALIARGQADGSIRDDLPLNVIGSVLIDGLYAIIQRLLPRKSHIEKEHSVMVDDVINFFLSALEASVREDRGHF